MQGELVALDFPDCRVWEVARDRASRGQVAPRAVRGGAAAHRLVADDSGAATARVGDLSTRAGASDLSVLILSRPETRMQVEGAAPDIVRQQHALSGLLLDLFGDAELRGFVQQEGAVTHARLPGPLASMEQLARSAGELLPLDEGLFERLAVARPEKRGQIAEVRHYCLAAPAPSFQGFASLLAGVAASPILDHASYLAQILGFQRFLLDSVLPFVNPAADSDWHPEDLWARLRADAVAPGLALVGVGGVGKTRTSLEVARRAHRDGWLVLHVGADEPPVTLAELAARLGTSARQALVVFDYLDQMHAMDWVGLARLRRSAAGVGLTVALLGSSRPGGRPNPARDACFTPLYHAPSPLQQETLLGELRRRAAPRACVHLGEARVAELCGERPIIALLVALELERRERDGTLAPEGLEGLRSGDLHGWLRKRLGEMMPPRAPGHPLAPEATPPHEVAAAAVLAAAPDAREGLEIAARLALGGRAADAPRVVDTLIALGWLETRESWLAVAHDVVADEVLERVLLPRGTLDGRAVEGVFESATGRARTLGRLVVALGRMAFSSARDDLGALLAPAVDLWWRSKATRLGLILGVGRPDVVSYALAAALTSPIFSSSVLSSWGATVAPWLEQHGAEAEARHLLYRGLKAVPVGELGTALIGHAMAWIAVHAGRQDAVFVFGPLLARPDLADGAPSVRTAVVCAAALGWLTAHGRAFESAYVLRSLLARSDLGEGAGSAVTATLRWIAVHGLALDARFVLGRVLERPDLGARTEDVVGAALAWADHHGLNSDASLVLGPLLGRSDLRHHARAALKLATRWLAEHGESFDARFVLAPILERSDLALDHAPGVIETPVEHGAEPGVALHPAALAPDLAEVVIAVAVGWLARHGAVLDAQRVLAPLLKRTDLKDHSAAAIDMAFRWLAAHGTGPTARFPLAALLKRDDVGERAPAAISAALDWLSLHDTTIEASFVYRGLLNHPPISAGERDRMVAWVVDYSDHDEVDFLANRLLQSAVLDARQRLVVAHVILNWCAPERPALERSFALGRVHAAASALDTVTLARWLGLTESLVGSYEHWTLERLASDIARLRTTLLPFQACLSTASGSRQAAHALLAAASAHALHFPTSAAEAAAPLLEAAIRLHAPELLDDVDALGARSG